MLKKTKEIVASIVVFETVLPDNVLFVNSKLATLAYEIEGKVYNSENTIQVPMTYDLGDKLTVDYDCEKPTKVYKKHLFVL